jgi:hypothetical protein
MEDSECILGFRRRAKNETVSRQELLANHLQIALRIETKDPHRRRTDEEPSVGFAI